jgi:hypothetical protein
MRSSFLTSVNFIEFYTVEAHSSSGLTKVKYNINKIPRVENESVTARVKAQHRCGLRKYSLHVHGKEILNRLVNEGL